MPVGITLVSHSVELVYGLRQILHQVAPSISITLAGGTDDNEIGTSLEKIKSAICNASTGDGVIVFFDLGSALLNTEMAIELLQEEVKDIVIANAPLIEGAYVAALEAECGSSLSQIVTALEKTREVNKLMP